MKLVTRVAAGVAGVLLLLVCLPISAGADGTVAPALSFREVKITNDEFVVVQATKDISDLSAYWLGYSSVDTATNIVPTQQLPAIPLKAGQAVLMTSDQAQTCDAVYSTKLSASLSDTKGALELRQLVNLDKSTSTFTTIDSVTWTKPSTTDKTPVTDNLDLRKETGIATPVWYHSPSAPSSAWAVGNFSACSLNIAQSTSAPSQTFTWQASNVDPPALIQSLSTDTASSDSGPIIPAVDFGLSPPQINELLPNPIGTGTDASDEFIELYNPNISTFDLSGFILQTGSTTKHSYTFPAGTSLPGKAFVAFYSADTGLSLSNTAGASDLEDPLGALLSQTDDYGTAKDGQSWSLAKGTWYWTTHPTPNASNIIVQPVATAGSSKKSSSSSKKSSASVKGASTSKVSSTLPSNSPAADTTQVTPIHPWTLAVVAALALAYGLYEYRLDLANYFHRFRRHRTPSRANG